MDAQKLRIRHCMLFEFDRGLSGAAVAKEICEVYGDRILTDQPREGRPSIVNDDVLESLLETNPRQTTRELAKQLGCSHTTVESHLHALGKIRKYGSWVPHELSANEKLRRVSACVSLLSHHQKSSFLERIVTGDQKWVLYINIGRKKQWLNPGQKPLTDVKADLHPKKVLLCIWWDLKGVLYYELLDNATITAEVYAHQLQRVQEALLEKRPTLINGK